MVRKFTAALDLVASGELHLSGLLVVAPVLTPQNHAELLAAACGKTKREVEMLVADRFPRPDAPAIVRKLPDRVVEGATRPRVEPLAPRRFRVTFTASAELVEKLERAQELASHVVAPNDLAALVERALDVLIAHEEKRRFAVRPERAAASSAARCALPAEPELLRDAPQSAQSEPAAELDPGASLRRTVRFAASASGPDGARPWPFFPLRASTRASGRVEARWWPLYARGPSNGAPLRRASFSRA